MDSMVPTARLRLPDGRLRDVAAGGIIGRLASAACRLDNPRVSEAHALLSLRDGALNLLALRGGLAVNGSSVREVILRQAMRIEFAEGVAVEVVDLIVPEGVLALRMRDGRTFPLLGEIWSLLDGPQMEFTSRFVEGAMATMWSTGSGWRWAMSGERPKDLCIGDSLEINGAWMEIVEISLSELVVPETRGAGRLHPPLRLRPTFTSVRLEVEGRPPVIISGVPGRILSELCEFHEPVDWKLVAELVWPDEEDAWRLRRNWDRNLRTLRDKLSASGLRQDLVLLDGFGNVVMHLLDGDALVS